MEHVPESNQKVRLGGGRISGRKQSEIDEGKGVLPNLGADNCEQTVEILYIFQVSVCYCREGSSFCIISPKRRMSSRSSSGLVITFSETYKCSKRRRDSHFPSGKVSATVMALEILEGLNDIAKAAPNR